MVYCVRETLGWIASRELKKILYECPGDASCAVNGRIGRRHSDSSQLSNLRSNYFRPELRWTSLHRLLEQISVSAEEKWILP